MGSFLKTKTKSTNFSVGCNAIDDDENDDGSERSKFIPIHLIFVWAEPVTLTKRFSIAMVQPSGIAAGQFSNHVDQEVGRLIAKAMAATAAEIGDAASQMAEVWCSRTHASLASLYFGVSEIFKGHASKCVTCC